jgi:hypothetical protein
MCETCVTTTKRSEATIGGTSEKAAALPHSPIANHGRSRHAQSATIGRPFKTW